MRSAITIRHYAAIPRLFVATGRNRTAQLDASNMRPNDTLGWGTERRYNVVTGEAEDNESA